MPPSSHTHPSSPYNLLISSPLLPGSTGDNGLAGLARLNQPAKTFVDAVGNLFVADTGNNECRIVQYGTQASYIYLLFGSLTSSDSVVYDASDGYIYVADANAVKRMAFTEYTYAPTSAPTRSCGSGRADAARSCSDILNDCNVKYSIRWLINPNDASSPYQTWCDSDGWALAMKINGRSNLLQYSSPYWTNTTLLNAGTAYMNKSRVSDSKFETAIAHPVQGVRMQMRAAVGGSRFGQSVEMFFSGGYNSLNALFATNTPQLTTANVNQQVPAPLLCHRTPPLTTSSHLTSPHLTAHQQWALALPGGITKQPTVCSQGINVGFMWDAGDPPTHHCLLTLARPPLPILSVRTR